MRPPRSDLRFQLVGVKRAKMNSDNLPAMDLSTTKARLQRRAGAAVGCVAWPDSRYLSGSSWYPAKPGRLWAASVCCGSGFLAYAGESSWTRCRRRQVKFAGGGTLDAGIAAHTQRVNTAGALALLVDRRTGRGR